MGNNRKCYCLSDVCVEQMAEIQRINNLKSSTAAIEFCVAKHMEITVLNNHLDKINHELMLQLKHINEIRRSNYIEINLLNAMTLALDISNPPAHHDKSGETPALITAKENLAKYLADVGTRIKENETMRKGGKKATDV